MAPEEEEPEPPLYPPLDEEGYPALEPLPEMLVQFESPITERRWVPPEDLATMPLKYQKNKQYFQFRIDELPEDTVRPRIFYGLSAKGFDPKMEISR